MALPLLELALKKRHKNLEMEHVDVEGETRISRIKDMWWLIGRAPDFWGRGLRFEYGISLNDPDALQDHFDKVENLIVPVL